MNIAGIIITFFCIIVFIAFCKWLEPHIERTADECDGDARKELDRLREIDRRLDRERDRERRNK